MLVLVTEKFITESWKGIDIKKPLHMSDVHVRADANSKWEQYGYIANDLHQLSGLVNRPVELGPSIADACTEFLKTEGPSVLRGKKITFVGAPSMDEEVDDVEQEESDDE